MKHIVTMGTAVLLMVNLALVGCVNGAANKSPRQAVQEAFVRYADVKSSKFEGSIRFNLHPPAGMMVDPSAAVAFNVLNNAELTMRGTYQLEPLKAEVLLSFHISGDKEMAVHVPVLIKERKVWIKIPNMPFAPLPEAGKYIESDMSRLLELSDEEFDLVQQEVQHFYEQLFAPMLAEVSEQFFGTFEEEHFYFDVRKDESNVPEEVDARRIIKFDITNENFGMFVEGLLDIFPQIIDIIAKYYDESDLDQAEVDELKAELKTYREDYLYADLEEYQKSVTINEASILTAIDADGFISYTDINMDMDIKVDHETGSIRYRYIMKQYEINEDPDFEFTEPDSSEIIKQEDWTTYRMYSDF